jgi:hypothetical protein
VSILDVSDDEGRRDGFETDLMQSFGVLLDAEEAGSCVTPSHTVAMIESKVELGGPGHRLMPVAWDRMRRALAGVLDRGTAEITPALDLDEAFPRRGRCTLWRRLEHELETTLPPAGRPDWVPMIIVFAMLASGYVLYILSIAEHLFYEWYYLITPYVIAAGAVAAGVLAFLLTRFVRVGLPYETAEDAARGLLTHTGDHAALNGGDPRWSREQIQEAVEILVRWHWDVDEVAPDLPLPD